MSDKPVKWYLFGSHDKKVRTKYAIPATGPVQAKNRAKTIAHGKSLKFLGEDTRGQKEQWDDLTTIGIPLGVFQ